MADTKLRVERGNPDKLGRESSGGRLTSYRGALLAGFLALFCCGAPILLVTLGTAAGLASRIERVRSLLVVLMVALIALGVYTLYRRRRA